MFAGKSVQQFSTSHFHSEDAAKSWGLGENNHFVVDSSVYSI